MTMKQKIIGFKLKIPKSTLSVLWSDSVRRTEYLLNPNIFVPLSADEQVWPEAKDQKLYQDMFENCVEKDDCKPQNGLNLYMLKKDNKGQLDALGQNRAVLVGFSVEEDLVKKLVAMHALDNPCELQTGQDFLGFDVCDQWLFSGLMNCKLSRQDLVEQLKHVYADKLNSFGLFHDYDVAMRFANDMDKLVPQHSNFFPVGIVALNKV